MFFAIIMLPQIGLDVSQSKSQHWAAGPPGRFYRWRNSARSRKMQDVAEFAFYEFLRDLWRHGKAATSSSGFIENSATSEVAESAGRPVLNREVAIE